MQVRIRLFAMMAQHAGTAQCTLDLPPDATLASVRHAIATKFSGLPWPSGTFLAVNQQYAPAQHPLAPNDEIAIIPPVSGG